MDQNIKKVFDEYRKKIIGVNEPFKFRCTMCGKCCRNREDILLNPFDFFRIVKGLRMGPQDVLKQYCETHIGGSSRVPLIRLRPIGVDRRCSLLRGNRCSVHNFKPTVCAMFPIGRMVFEYDEKLNPVEQKHIDYFFINPHCGDKKETHTVSEWLGRFGLPLEDEFFLKWTVVLTTMSLSLQKLEKHLYEDNMIKIWSSVFGLIYMSYDMEKEFLPQFESNAQNITKFLNKLCDIIIKE